ncbi:MAG TPA: acetate/propionate family kinase [Candidatus Limnocylindrales bacterium]|nr:acetate/propionate family kinase [Candidatus Limnocylindrales bacterium]
MPILVVNSGSSSLKLRLVEGRDAVVSADLPAIDIDAATSATDALERAIGEMQARHEIEAVGHRIVHGGTELTAATAVDEDVLGRLRALSDLAPLHQQRCIAAVEAARRALPALPHVACFDTAFHATLPAAAATYALPAAWRARWPLRRFGFHGLSHAWAARRVAELLDRPIESLRTVTCHLGAGASLAAVAGGRSVDTTMGFTPLEGLVMATRSGSVDPGLVLWLQRHGGLAVSEVADGLEHGSGLLGLTGTADMRTVLASAQRGEREAVDGVAVYLHRLRSEIAAMTASLGGLDALVFTGGVGEHAAAIRSGAVDGLEFLGLALDADANGAATRATGGVAGDRRIDRGDGPAIVVIESREDLEIAGQVRSVLH